MGDGDKRAFKALVDVLAMNYSRETSPPFYRVLWLGLKDLPLADTQRAFEAALKTCAFFPTVAKLRALAGHGESSRLTYYQPWDPGKSLPAWEEEKPEVGGFRKYLADLAESKAAKP